MLKNKKSNLLWSIATDKVWRNLEYLKKITDDNLLLPFRYEAGLINRQNKNTDVHWGWDSIYCQIRGTFTGHWLSAMARMIYTQNDPSLKARANYIVDEIYNCQNENAGGWAFPIPEKYLHWIKRGKRVWAPHYVCHKVMMGLLDMYLYAENEIALTIVKKCADWFYDFTKDIDEETMDNMLDFEETGGLMELWADLYAVTKNEKHKKLIYKYERRRLFNAVFNGEDVLTNRHANTTIPEIHGAARAYEVTGEERFRKIVEIYWDLGVDSRGSFVTGGQSSGEVWAPPGQQAKRLSPLAQEHCVVYNLMRLSQYLYRWTGDSKFADYFEQNLYNGIFAQGFCESQWTQLTNEDHPTSKGLIAYYLPNHAGSKKEWGSETNHFWCCHCTLVQANAFVFEHVFYEKGNEIFVAQYLPAEMETEFWGKKVTIKQEKESLTDWKISGTNDRTVLSRPKEDHYKMEVKGNEQEFTIKIRLPWWLAKKAVIKINGEEIEYVIENGHAVLTRVWGSEDVVNYILPKEMKTWTLPDLPNYVAFIEGPIAYAGLASEERTIYGDITNPESFMIGSDERHWGNWRTGWRTINQDVNIEFVPIYQICNEVYTVYFPVLGAEPHSIH